MANILLMANFLPIVFAPNKINGKLTKTNRIPNGILDFTRISNETPVAPPSMNSFGQRKPLSPNPAANTPTIKNKISLIVWATSTCPDRTSLTNCLLLMIAFSFFFFSLLLARSTSKYCNSGFMMTAMRLNYK